MTKGGLNKNYCSWSEYIEEEFESNYQNLLNLPDVFIYLMYGSDPICYWKGKPTDFTNVDAKLNWVNLQIDYAAGKVKKHHMSGILQMRLLFIDVTHPDSTKAEEDQTKRVNKLWGKKNAARSDIVEVRCYIYQCRNLPPMDDTGASDPYVEVWSTNDMP